MTLRDELERLSHNAQIMGWTRDQAALDEAIAALFPSPVETPQTTEPEACGEMSGFGDREWYSCTRPQGHTTPHRNKGGFAWVNQFKSAPLAPAVEPEPTTNDEGAGRPVVNLMDALRKSLDSLNQREAAKESGPRYCPMCDEFMNSTTCKACGMPTERAK